MQIYINLNLKNMGGNTYINNKNIFLGKMRQRNKLTFN